MSFIKCAKIKKNQIPIIVGCFFSFLSRLLLKAKNTTLFTQHRLISNISAAIIRIFTFIPLIIQNIQNKSETNRSSENLLKDVIINKRGNGKIKKIKEKISKILYIFLSSITFFAQGIIFAFCLDVKSNSWISEILFFCLFSYLMFKFKPQNYHYLSIITIVVLGIVLDLINENFRYDILTHWHLLLLKYVREIIYSFHETINKYAM